MHCFFLIRVDQTKIHGGFGMKNTTDSTHAATQSYEEQRNGLNFFEKVLTEPGEPEDKRKEVLEYCSNQAVEERTIWRKLALFREMGSTEHLFEKEPYHYFDLIDEQVRERILVLIKKLPKETLSDFRELITFTDRFLERLQFLCDSLLHLFLEREKGAYRESWDMSVYTDFFDHKMFREFEMIHDITDRYLFRSLNDKYESWLCDKLLDEEVLI
ncbi:hypothetical protein ES705_40531 [subsurface metagenome]